MKKQFGKPVFWGGPGVPHPPPPKFLTAVLDFHFLLSSFNFGKSKILIWGPEFSLSPPPPLNAGPEAPIPSFLGEGSPPHPPLESSPPGVHMFPPWETLDSSAQSLSKPISILLGFAFRGTEASFWKRYCLLSHHPPSLCPSLPSSILLEESQALHRLSRPG